MLGHAPPVRPAAGEDDETRHRRGVPSEICGDADCQTSASVHRGHQVHDVHEFGLEFHNEHAAGRFVPGQDVDDPAFAAHGEGHLRPHRPAGSGSEERREPFVKLGVPAGDESVEFAAVPARNEVEPHLEGSGHASERRKRDLIELSALDPGDRGARAVGSDGEVHLPPAAAATKDAKDRTTARGVHGSIVGPSPLPSRIACDPSRRRPFLPPRSRRRNRTPVLY